MFGCNPFQAKPGWQLVDWEAILLVYSSRAMTSFQPDDILLLGPGPSPVSHRVRAAMAAPLVGHLDPSFLQLMDTVQRELRTWFGTRHRFTIPVSGTGSAGMECCLTNLVVPGDRVVVGVNGVFGQRMVDLVERLGGTPVAVKAEFGRPLDPTAIEAAVKQGSTQLLAVVHAETSTGVLQPLEPLAEIARTHGAMFLVDAVTSLGGARVDVDSLGIDAVYSGTQKCVSAPPGLAPVSFSDAARARASERPGKAPSWYLDVNLLDGYWGGERAYHHTAPISMVYALAESLAEMRDEGPDARFLRHEEAAAALYRGVAALGMECLVEPSLRTPMLTSICIPEGVDDQQVRRTLRQRHCIEIGGGLGSLAGRVWRVGLMGHGARTENVVRLVEALAVCLQEQGRSVSARDAVQAVTH